MTVKSTLIAAGDGIDESGDNATPVSGTTKKEPSNNESVNIVLNSNPSSQQRRNNVRRINGTAYISSTKRKFEGATPEIGAVIGICK